MGRIPKNRKLERIHTPLGLDQLEARMLCAIDTSLDLLLSVEAVSSPKVSAVQSTSNRAPMVARAVSTSTPSQSIVRTIQLSALGADDRGESALTYRWSVTPTTTAGGTGTFSANETNAAKNTSLTFTKAGTYDVRVTIRDQGGLTVASSLRVTVNQLFTSIGVTPGTGSVAAGRTLQLTARGLDQFQQPLTRQPTLTWSTNSGSVSQTGLFTAPNAAANATISVRSGSITGTSRVTVAAPTPAPTPSNNGIQNAALSNLINTYFADGSVTRSEVIALLRSAGSDGQVDATELNDFRYIVSNATRFKIPSYVQVLAGSVVNSNPANSLHQGQTAGNLASGSSASLLNKLVDKWFLGTDLPALTRTSISYQIASGSLFNGTPSRNNMKQGSLGDCYFIASLGAVADQNPSAVSNMFIDNGDGTFTVRFYTGPYGAFYNTDGTISDGFRSGTGTADYVTVNRSLPAYSNGTFAYSGMGSRVTEASNSLWIALAEKAYAQWNATGKSGRDGTNRYSAIEGGWMGVVNAQILGYNATNYNLNAAGQQALNAALGSGKAVTIGTKSAATANGLVGGHAYTIVGYNTSSQTYTLFNPWGTTHPSPLTWAQLQTNCSMFVVANPSGSTPTVASGATPSVRGSLESASFEFVATIANASSSTAEYASFEQIQNGNEEVLDAIATACVESAPTFESEIGSEEDYSDLASNDESTSDVIDRVLASLNGVLDFDYLG